MSGNRHHVLVVEDDEALCKYVVLHLRQHGYRVSSAGDGASGLAAVRRDPPDLVILDHFLPDMTGEDVLTALRATPEALQIPVIYLTVDGSRKRLRKSMTGGADDFISKPFKPRELVDAVAVQLRKHYARMVPRFPANGSDQEQTAHLAAELRLVEQRLTPTEGAAAGVRAPPAVANPGDADTASEETRILQSANRSLKDYAAAVAHELKRPMRGILGYAGILQESHGEALTADARELLSRIESNGRRMADYIDALLTLGDTSRADVERSAIDMSAMAGEVVALLLASNKGPLTEVHIAPGLSSRAAPVLVRVILENLLSNAFKYSSKAALPCVEFGAVQAATDLEFFVRDNGVGFDMRHAEHLFKPFHRLHPAGDFEGKGIGLATVRAIIERHNGQMRAEASPGQGATFYFSLN